MYRRPLIPRFGGEPYLGMGGPGEMDHGPDEVTFEVTGGSVAVVVPPECPDDAIFDQECAFLYCQLYLEDKLVLEAWIPQDTPYLMVRELKAGQDGCGTGWGP